MTSWRDWVHIMCSTRGQWLPGDPRGFRDHDHRIHSSGNYKDLPPLHEHAGLRVYAARLNKLTIVLTRKQRAAVGEALIEKLQSMSVPTRILAAGATHVHALIRVGADDAVAVFGRAKQLASHRIRDQLPGTIWGEGSHPVRVTGSKHYRAVVDYIRDHAADSAWVWDAKAGINE